MDKEILSAALWFIVCAVVMTAVGNFVCPQIGNIAASNYYNTLKPIEKMVDAKAAKTKSSEKTAAEIVTAEAERSVKESPATVQPQKPETALPETAVQEKPAEKKPEIAASEAASSVSEKADVPSQTELSENSTADPKAGFAEKPEKDAEAPVKEAETAVTVKKTLTEAEISEATKSLPPGETTELGDGRVAYRIKRGDTFSQICKKVFDTSLGWKEKAKKLNIDYRKIRPGDVLIFEKNI